MAAERAFAGKYMKHWIRREQRSLSQVTTVEMDAPLVQTAVEVFLATFLLSTKTVSHIGNNTILSLYLVFVASLDSWAGSLI